MRQPRRPRYPSVIGSAALAVTLLIGDVGGAALAAVEQPLSERPDDRVGAAESDPTPSPKPKPTPWPTPPGVKGLDVSHWNGYPNFAKLRDKGMRFVFSKATQGTKFVDDTYQRHSREARDAGILPGAYHFFDYNKGGVGQARHFLDTLRATTGLDALLPLVVDVETLGSLGKPNKSKAKARLHTLLDELYRQTGRYPMIYTSRHMWEKVVGAPTSFGNYPLWVACWKCDTVHMPAGWSDWDFWQVGQFKFFGSLKLDGNIYSGSMDKLRLERQRGMRLDNGATWAADRSVKADLRGHHGSGIRVAIGAGTFGPWRPFERRPDIRLRAGQGRQDVRIQLRSFRGVRTVSLRDDIKLDSVPPSVDGPRISLRHGDRVRLSGDRIPIRATMAADDKTSGVKTTSLRATCGGVQRAARFDTAGRATLPVQLDRRGCVIKASAADVVGHNTSRQLGPEVALTDIRKGSGKISFKGSWKTLKNGDALGKSLARTAARGAQARMTFKGAQVAIVARRGPAGGRLKVIIDGKHVDTIDLYSAKSDSRRIVSVQAVKKGKHVLKLRATGTAAPKSTGAIVWLDAVVALDRRK